MMNSLPQSPSLPAFDPTPRQREILERALELVQESGLANLTLKKVAERVGFTEAAIYRHFASKAVLLDGLVALLGSRLLGPAQEIAADGSRPAAERLERMVRHHVAVLRASRGLPLLLIAEGLAAQDEELLSRLRAVMTVFLGLLAGLLEELELPVDLPAQAQALPFLGLSAALGLQMRAFPESVPEDDEVERLITFLVRALTSGGRTPPESPS